MYIYIWDIFIFFFDAQDKVRLLPGEKTLDLQIFSDATFLEASWLQVATFSVRRAGWLPTKKEQKTAQLELKLFMEEMDGI